MTFADIYGEVILLRFNNNFVAQAKSWVNTRYALVWNANDWTFRTATSSVTVTSGSSALTGVPADFQRVNFLYDNNGTALTYMTPQVFYSTYPPAVGGTDAPMNYTVINGSILVGPTSNTTSSSFTLVYERKCVLMSADSDVPAIPTEYHYMLVHGALATGLVTQNDFTFAQEEEMYQQLLQSMANAYSSDYGGTLQYERDVFGLNSYPVVGGP